VTTHVSAKSLGRERDIARAVSVRTKDDVAVIQDLPQGRNQLAHGFPITPAFDALSYFTLSWKVGPHQEVSAYVHDVTPLTYTAPQPGEADVVVVRLRAYQATYAPDSSDTPTGQTHILLEPFDFVKREVKRPDSTFYLHELFIDNASGLPVRVRYTGGDDIDFSVDYANVQGHWVVNHAHYEETVYGPLRIGRLHVAADAAYDQFTFPDQPPDPRLAPPSEAPR